MRRRLATVAGLLLAILLLARLVLNLENPDEVATAFASAGRAPGWLLVGILAFGAALLSGALRWLIILRDLRLPIGGWRAFQLYAIGHFFNVLIPGATGGDIIRATFAATDSPGRQPEAVASILAERLFGLIVLGILAAVVALVRPAFFRGSTELQLLYYFCLLLGAGALAGSLLLFGINWEKILPQAAESGRWARVVEIVRRLYSAARICAARPATLGWTLFFSLTNHVMNIISAWGIGRALQLAIGLPDYITAIPVVNIVAAVPITPGGAGVRDKIVNILLTGLGVSDENCLALSLMINGVIIIWALLGGIGYLILRRRTGRMATSGQMA